MECELPFKQSRLAETLLFLRSDPRHTRLFGRAITARVVVVLHVSGAFERALTCGVATQYRGDVSDTRARCQVLVLVMAAAAVPPYRRGQTLICTSL
jgi:hypothetical protein